MRQGLSEPAQDMDDAVVDEPANGEATSSLAASLHEAEFCDRFSGYGEIV